ncbi:twin-arginine translocase subunit TatB [Hyphomicrobium methylovorum]|uniref:Sec-independent protein translocase protein TatB n=1 Tax=Hyphomicrobium methylovorum TaxID=84 RepID=UPI0015E78FA7|nr:Sec-independent protein translocase protein TatB [Hyphomicrobium methylovorum]MBA2127534.1 twin-arginine translocase subunit TatB [Hyphomicrobium methylovorum]
MFEISWSEILILGIVVLVFVGPKELPVFMRTLGKYAGVVRRHANDFKAQFDAAMREAELDSMRQEVDKMQASINSEVMRAGSTIDSLQQSASADISSSSTTSTTSADTALVSDSAVHPAPANTLAPPMPSPPGQER